MTNSNLRKYDLYSQEFKANAYNTYNQMRAENPVLAQQAMQAPVWFVTGYEEAKQILSDHKCFVSDYRNALTAAERAQLPSESGMYDLLYNNMLSADSADHTRLRAIVGKAFTTRRVQSLAPRIQEIADELLDAVQELDQMDLIDAYAFPLPIIVICELLGIPAADRHKFRTWSNAFLGIGEDHLSYLQNLTEFIRYIGQMIAERRENPGDDLVSALVHAEEDGQRLSEQELYSMIALLIVAGHETTVGLITNGMLALLQNPEQMALLQENPEMTGMAVEEFLRYDNPVERSTTRFAAKDVEISGQMINRGSPVIVVLGSANRDPSRFKDAERLDITHQDKKHLGFGYGVHYCLGAPLARLEGSIAINTLLRRIPNLQLAVPVSELQYRPNAIIRGLVRLPVSWKI